MRRLALLAALALAAFLGNVWAPSVVPGVRYLPGSVPVLLAVGLAGWRSGLPVALASVVPLLPQGTYVLAAVLVLEPLAVGVLLRRRPDFGLFTVDTLFWVLLGGPLIWGLTPDPVGSLSIAGVAALYQVVVGLTNALAAELARLTPPLRRWAGAGKAPELSFQSLLFEFMGGVAMILILVLLTWTGRSEFLQIHTLTQQTLQRHAHSVEQQVTQRLAGPSSEAPTDDVLSEILMSEAGQQGVDLAFLDADGQVLATTYAQYRQAELQRLLRFADRWQPERTPGGLIRRPNLTDFRDWRDARYRMVQPITAGGVTGVLLLEQPVTPMLLEVYRHYLSTLLIGVSLLLVKFGLIGWLSRRLSESLRGLGAVTASLPARLHGNHHVRWPDSRVREIRWLTDSVRHMDQRLRQEFQAAQHANRRLEQEVRERRAADAALAESEARFRQLAEHLHHAVFWMSSADGRQLLYASPAYERIWGRDLDALYAGWPRSWLASVHPKDRPAMARRLEAGTLFTEPLNEEYRIARPDGAIRWIRAVGFPIRDAHGVVYRYAGLAEDVTEVREAQDRLWRQQAELSHLARLKVVSEMAAGLAHELNQPLAAIAVYTQTCESLLRSENPPLEKVTSIMEKVAAQSLRAGDIVRRLRGFMTQASPRLEPVDVNALVQEVLAFLEFDTRQRDVRLHLDLQPDLPPAWADGIQIQQVLVNLIQNALDAVQTALIAPEERALWIRTERVDERTLAVAVRDTGAGIPDDVRERLFQPFVTTKAQGTGLGLWISQSILDLHGGHLSAENRSEGGAEFRFTLPLAQDGQPRPDARATASVRRPAPLPDMQRR